MVLLSLKCFAGKDGWIDQQMTEFPHKYQLETLSYTASCVAYL